MRILNILVPQMVLNEFNLLSGIQNMNRDGMPQRMNSIAVKSGLLFVMAKELEEAKKKKAEALFNKSLKEKKNP